MEKVIKFAGSDPLLKSKFKFRFSTVNEYFLALEEARERMGFEWSTYEDDFYPYMGQYAESYWVGYFSSRPAFKGFIRGFSGLT
jgi:lysosomal alpha-mannosidase